MARQQIDALNEFINIPTAKFDFSTIKEHDQLCIKLFEIINDMCLYDKPIKTVFPNGTINLYNISSYSYGSGGNAYWLEDAKIPGYAYTNALWINSGQIRSKNKQKKLKVFLLYLFKIINRE